MASIIQLTSGQPVIVTAAPTFQPLFEAIDISGFDILDLELGVVGLVGGGSATIKVVTGMQTQVEDASWVTAIAFTAVSTSPSYELITKNLGLLRYVRWEVSALSGTTPSVTFWIRGMARKYSCNG